ncbi:MATE family efflux transporter [Epibacterium sp. SM1979]|uniref:Multidrug-efflux transporter n=1 Tax=Tritonibacter litoralis TaxID=2662264 RepID=A0A843YFL7_9RHOB|nr:MATE family efflux transporter [Tritonibacter litoralis]MQQ09886.1 MATE family efflux transporter [Tritonibacter litoralis]
MTHAAPPSTPMTSVGHIRAIAILGLPLIGGHVAQFAIGLTDAAMLGWYSTAALAAVTLASSYFHAIFLFGAGFAFAVLPLVAEAAGRGDSRMARRSNRMGMWLSMLYGALAMPAFLWAEPILRTLGQDPQVAKDAAAYLSVMGWGIFPALAVMVLKSTLAAQERTQVVLWMTLAAAGVNAAVNYVLIFGNFGAPELGLTGAAIASLMTVTTSGVILWVYCQRALPEQELFRNFHQPDWEMFARLFRLGLPIGFTTLAEVSLFTASAFMMGWISPVTLAAHGIALNLAGLTFMIHLGLSNVATIRVGNALGRKDLPHMLRGARMLIAISFTVAMASVAAFLLWPTALISLFLDPKNPDYPLILTASITLLMVAAVFQLMDGLQAQALGLLRGLQDTNVPMVIAVFGYWAVGLPTGYILGFVFDLGGVGVWIGLVTGLSLVGALLLWRFWGFAVHRTDLF